MEIYSKMYEKYNLSALLEWHIRRLPDSRTAAWEEAPVRKRHYDTLASIETNCCKDSAINIQKPLDAMADRMAELQDYGEFGNDLPRVVTNREKWEFLDDEKPIVRATNPKKAEF